MISKKLLDVVYPTDETQECYVDIQESTGRVMWFGKKYKDCRSEIDIHRVAHKCKEWAYSQGYILFSKIRLNSSLASCYFDTMGKHDYEDDYHNDFRAETEPEAIFKACEWILEQTQNKKDYK